MSADETDCTLDQWLTSAMSAMGFAAANWEQFCEQTERVIGNEVPITCGMMLHHAAHLAALADPERMPA